MGLRINSFAGLSSARGYKLCLLAFSLHHGSPEEAAIAKYFGYMADALGEDGLIVTGEYDTKFREDPTGFLNAVKLAVQDVTSETTVKDKLPRPALVALRAADEGDGEVGYFSLKDLSEHQIIALFRKIVDAPAAKGGIEALPENLLRSQPVAKKLFWDSIQLKPALFGVGADLKPAMEAAYSGVKKTLAGR